MKAIKIPIILKKFNEFFIEAGFDAYLVGGSVRDIFLGKKPHDYDVATNATPQQVMKIFKKVIPTGIQHGTVTVLFYNEKIEVTTFRIEDDYSDARHPDNIKFASTIEEDLSRRDFTMNAIAISLTNENIVDSFNGTKDIKNKLIRTCGDPEKRFNEDGLRPVRAIRFASQLGFTIEKETFDAIPKSIDKTAQISIERFRDEFTKLLKSDKPSVGLKLLEKTNLLLLFIPELTQCRNVTQADERGYHMFDILDHLFFSCDGAPKDNIVVRLAALFHDVGKYETRNEEIKQDITGKQINAITFYGHEKKSVKITEKILKRLKFSNKIVTSTLHLIENHMFHYESNWKDSAVRRLIKKVGLENFDDLFDLRLADVYGMTNSKPIIGNNRWTENLIELKERIKKEVENNNAFTLKDLAINGKDLIDLGIKNGKMIGYILNKLLESVLDDPKMNNKTKLIEIAKKLADV